MQQKHEISLRYADSYATSKHAVVNGLDAVRNGNGSFGATDRRNLTLTLKTQF